MQTESASPTTEILSGLALAGYRSFGAEVQYIGPFKKINVFAGMNNAGKSNILRFLHRHIEYLHTQRFAGTLDPHADRCLTVRDNQFTAGLAIPVDSSATQAALGRLEGDERTFLQGFFSRLSERTQTPGLIWFTRSAQLFGEPLQRDSHLNAAEVYRPQDSNMWGRIAQRLISPQFGSTELKTRVDRVMDHISPFPEERQLRAHLVPAIRKIGCEKKRTAEGSDDWSGEGIINRLNELKNPKRENDHEGERLFHSIESFVRRVTRIDDATLVVPHTLDAIDIKSHGIRLPLESLGTGIHEAVILATAATINENQIVCLEEPELHLHPALQRRLIEYLYNSTNNQYFITTHSATLMDYPNAALFHVRLEDQCTKVERVATESARWTAVRAMGYRASEIVQANCIVWVEGPSDRVYLNRWIALSDQELVEGFHYSIMFYGGRLLKHLTAQDASEEDVNEFIELCKINRNVAVLMDSDKKSESDRIGRTKERILSELKDSEGFVWTTKGREIENYVPADTFRAAADKICPGVADSMQCGQYGDRFRDSNEAPLPINSRKLELASEVVALQDMLPDELDLKSKMQELVAFVRRANE